MKQSTEQYEQIHLSAFIQIVDGDYTHPWIFPKDMEKTKQEYKTKKKK